MGRPMWLASMWRPLRVERLQLFCAKRVTCDTSDNRRPATLHDTALYFSIFVCFVLCLLAQHVVEFFFNSTAWAFIRSRPLFCSNRKTETINGLVSMEEALQRSK